MNTFLQKNKHFLFFLLKFLGSYSVLFLVYTTYLQSFSEKNKIDNITTAVTKATVQLLHYKDAEAKYVTDTNIAYTIIYKQEPIARIIEGCNAISVIILFIAFVFSFSSTFLKTTLFIVSGSLLIYFLNIIRIFSIIVLMVAYPEYKKMLHDIVFPLFIYGVVFSLWLVWIVKYSGYGKRNSTK